MSIDVPVGVKLVLPYLTQLPCIESLRRRLLCPCVLPFSLHSVHKYSLYCTVLAATSVSTMQASLWVTCKAFTHDQLQDVSLGWGQRFMQHLTSPIPLAASFHKFISICTPAKRLTSVRLLAVDIVHCLQLAWPGTFPWHITTQQVIHGSVTGCGR